MVARIDPGLNILAEALMKTGTGGSGSGSGMGVIGYDDARRASIDELRVLLAVVHK